MWMVGPLGALFTPHCKTLLILIHWNIFGFAVASTIEVPKGYSLFSFRTPGSCSASALPQIFLALPSLGSLTSESHFDGKKAARGRSLLSSDTPLHSLSDLLFTCPKSQGLLGRRQKAVTLVPVLSSKTSGGIWGSDAKIDPHLSSRIFSISFLPLPILQGGGLG